MVGACFNTKTNAELLDDPFKLPAVPFQFQNYSNAIREAGLGKLIINSLIISTSATFLNILFSSMYYCYNIDILFGVRMFYF